MTTAATLNLIATFAVWAAITEHFGAGLERRADG